jgi:hypothetical protein
MLKIMPEESLNIVGGRISNPASSMLIDILLYDSGLTLTSNVASLTFASLKSSRKTSLYLSFLPLVQGKSRER